MGTSFAGRVGAEGMPLDFALCRACFPSPQWGQPSQPCQTGYWREGVSRGLLSPSPALQDPRQNMG